MQKAIRFVTILFLAVSLLGLLLIPIANLSRDRDEDGSVPAADPESETTADSADERGFGPSPSPTLCPQATPEILRVEPVDSPTGALTQTIVIYIGSGEYAEVEMETGVYTQTGEFDASNNPAMIEVQLASGMEHHLTAAGRVKVVQVGGCQYGGYTLYTKSDSEGSPLTIIQSGDEQEYLPVIENE